MARRRITVEDDAEILVHWRAGIEPLVQQGSGAWRRSPRPAPGPSRRVSAAARRERGSSPASPSAL